MASLGAEHVIEFAVTDPARLPDDAVLRALPGVTDVRRETEYGVAGDLGSASRRAGAARYAARRGARDLEPARPTHSATLEDVFVSLTGQASADDGAY